jgi:hypothetical protein
MRNRQTTPYLVFFLLTVVFLLVLMLSLLLPPEILSGTKFVIRIPQLNELFPDHKKPLQTEQDIPSYQLDTTPVSDAFGSVSPELFSETLPGDSEDSVRNDGLLAVDAEQISSSGKTIPVTDEHELLNRIVPVSYSGRFEHELHLFFQRISLARSKGELIRVLHYGDSQIEGDRITSELRNFMHAEFGGSGPGLVSVVPPTRFDIIYQTALQGNWKRYSHLSRDLKHKRWGVLFGFARFLEPGQQSQRDVDVSFELRPRRGHYPSVRGFYQARIFFGYHRLPLNVELSRSGIELEGSVYPAEDKLLIASYRWRERVNDLTVRMYGKSSPDVFAVALDDVSGVAVDNIPLRGSSGLEFSRSDTSFLRTMMNELNTGMVLLQFGVNVVPNISGDYSFYENSLYRQLVVLKEIVPGVPVIVLGVSDMSRMERGAYKSYPNIELIRNAQKNAALRAGCGFWDTYEAMGGENSMAAWAFAEPPLAQKDFTHFSPRGSRIIGQMFWNTLMSEYKRYVTY